VGGLTGVERRRGIWTWVSTGEPPSWAAPRPGSGGPVPSDSLPKAAAWSCGRVGAMPSSLAAQEIRDRSHKVDVTDGVRRRHRSRDCGEGCRGGQEGSRQGRDRSPQRRRAASRRVDPKRDPAVWRRSFQLLAITPIELTTLLLPSMRARGFGRVVSILSSGIRQPSRNSPIRTPAGARLPRGSRRFRSRSCPTA